MEENVLTFSRTLLTVWQILPRIMYGDGKPYWLIAAILGFTIQANQSGGWLLGLLLVCITLEIILTLVQINGKFQFGKEVDARTCKRFDNTEKDWKDIPYDNLTAGDIIKLMP